jgi:transcription antitermination factor NusG
MIDQKEPLWYTFVTRSRAEKKVKQSLDALGIENYLPLKSQISQWKDRRKKVELPLFSGYIFIKTPFTLRYEIFKVPGVARMVSFEKKPTPVREEEIENIKLVLSSDLDVKVEHGFVEGDAVEIKSGILQGLKGRIKEHKGQHVLCIYVDAVAQSILVDIGSNVVERI